MTFGEPPDISKQTSVSGMRLRPDTKPPENPEQQELLSEILKNGGINLMICFPVQNDIKNQKQLEPHRMYSVGNAFSNVEEYKTGKKFQKIMEENKINEAVTLVPRQKNVYKESQELGPPKGLFRKRELIPKQVLTGTEPVLHSVIVEGGKNEPAYELMYKIFDDDRYGPQGIAYRDNTNREQIFELTIILPESEAKKTLEQIKLDPSFIRKVAEKAVIEQLGIPEERWREGKKDNHGHPLRPPYEEWKRRNNGKNKMYFHETGKPIDLNNVKEF